MTPEDRDGGSRSVGIEQPDLNDYRSRIDAIDDRIIALLAERRDVAHDVAGYKRRHGIAVRMPDRIEAVKTRCMAAGAKRDLDPAYVRALWTVIIEETCRVEEGLVAAEGALP